MFEYVPLFASILLLIVSMSVLKRRKYKRMAAILFLILFSAWLVFFGAGWRIDGIPAKYFGYFLGAFTVAGLFGLNIWYGGPLDPRQDPENERKTEKLRSAQPIACIPMSHKLPNLWPNPMIPDAQPNLSLLGKAEASVLMELCDDYWNSFLPNYPRIDETTLVVRSTEAVAQAVKLLGFRGPEILAWARARLGHSSYDARENAAWLFGQLAERGELGEQKNGVARELAELAVKPWQEDAKEAQANGVALDALSKIGGPTLIEALRRILTSHEWDDDDLQWDAMQILARVANVRFMDAKNPTEAAIAWLANNP